ncbi:MAG: hypothetical protein N0A16_09855 [Blastocatellia bacterium]|nr:hypothetical protein [Blastocatellia bacterium]MCS7158019.1 hypothetical protein [Blastocatellia bacterium]MCX7752526.1 hypothetical protein [Blastocatellia bacterium]MDW8167359.1 hypothetical protein [Acidobacteriota bacterium]MDW8257316.1 hypothetical protein [Acidobacteriota bacterium]
MERFATDFVIDVVELWRAQIGWAQLVAVISSGIALFNVTKVFMPHPHNSITDLHCVHASEM